jgi:hypothetical protein
MRALTACALMLALCPFWLLAAEPQEPIPVEIIHLLLPPESIRHIGYDLDYREDLSRGSLVVLQPSPGVPAFAQAVWSVTRGGGRLRPVLAVLELERFLDRDDALRYRSFADPGAGSGDVVNVPMGERGFYSLSLDGAGASCRVTVQQNAWAYRLLVTVDDVASTESSHPDPCQEIAFELAWEISGRLRDPGGLLTGAMPPEPDFAEFEVPEGEEATPHSPAESVARTVAVAVAILVAAGIAVALARSIMTAFAGALTAGGPPTTHEAAAGLSERIISRAERVAAQWLPGRRQSTTVIEEAEEEEEEGSPVQEDQGTDGGDDTDQSTRGREEAYRPSTTTGPATAIGQGVAETGPPPAPDAAADSLPELVDPYDDHAPLLTNEAGQYFDPYAGKWVSLEQARRLVEELTRRLAEERAAEKKAAKEEAGFFEGLWDRFSKDLRGIRKEMALARHDILRDPWIVWDATKRAWDEGWDTAVDVVDLTGKALSAVGEGLETVARDPAGTLQGAVELHREVSIAAVEAVGRAGKWLSPRVDHALENPVETAVATGRGIAWGAGKVGEVLTNPDNIYDGIKLLSGASDLGKSMEEGKSLPVRLGHMGLAILGATGAFGATKAVARGARRGATKLIGRVRKAAAQKLGIGSADDLARVEGRRRLEAVRRRAAELRRREALRKGGGAKTETIDQMKKRLANQKRGPVKSAKRARRRQSYADHLKRRTKTKHSTIRPGDPSDLRPARGVKPDTSGYARVSERNIQMVADKYGVTVYTRPTNTPAKALLKKKLALPKPELLKNKTMSELDVLLIPGAGPEDVGKVAHFKPVLPPQGSMTDEAYAALKARADKRAQEFLDQSKWLAKHRDKVRIDGHLIRDVKTGKPFTGDVDGFAIRGMHGETLPKALVDKIQRELVQGPGHVMHGFHTEWNYSGLSRDVPGPSRIARLRQWLFGETPKAGAQSKFEMSRAIDRVIRGSHAPGPKGEALPTFRAAEGLGAPNPTASFWHGGVDNPLISP